MVKSLFTKWMELPITGVFEIVRLCDIFQPGAPEFYQLADMEIVMRDHMPFFFWR